MVCDEDEMDFALEEGHIHEIARIVNDTPLMNEQWLMIMGTLLSRSHDAAKKGKIEELLHDFSVYAAVQLTLKIWIATSEHSPFNELLRSIHPVNPSLKEKLNAEREVIRSNAEAPRLAVDLSNQEQEQVNEPLNRNVPYHRKKRNLSYGLNAWLFSIGVIIIVITIVGILYFYISRANRTDEAENKFSGPDEPVTFNHTNLEFQDYKTISNLVYLMSSTDPPEEWFNGCDRTTLEHLTIRGDFTRAQISPILGSNLQYSLETLTFKDPHICKAFQYNSSEMCAEIFEFKKLKTLEFLDIGSECTELFEFFSTCVRVPKGCIIRFAQSTRLKSSNKSLKKLKEKTGCEMLVHPIPL